MYDLPSLKDLRRLRISAGLTQAELAARVGMSQSLIARIEAGDVDPRFSTYSRILQALKSAEIEKQENKPTASDIMKSPVIHVKPEDTVGTAAKLMERHGISQLPVLEYGVQIGSISETKVIWDMMHEKDPAKFSAKKVKDMMNESFPTVSRSTDLKTLSKIIEHTPAVLVVEKGKVVGIVTKADILKLMK